MARGNSPPSSPPSSEDDGGVRGISSDLDYDPNQDPDEKRDIRRNMRANISEANEQKSNINNVKVLDLKLGLERQDQEFERVKDTSEALLDSRYLALASEMSAAKAKAMKSDANSFDVDDFVSKLVTFMGGRRGGLRQRGDSESTGVQGEDSEDDEDDEGSGNLDWAKVGRLALAKSRRVPVIDFMLGPLSTEQKQRKKIVRDKYEKNKEPERAPQQLTEEDMQRSENETTKNVVMIKSILEEQEESINLFRFIINPYDYGQSVENLFYLSFLIREGTCAMEFDEETLEPVIYTCHEPSDQDFINGVQKQQIVLEFDMDTWQRAIEIFDIKEPIIPHREEVKTEAMDGKVLLQ